MDISKSMLANLLQYTSVADQLFIDTFSTANVQLEKAQYLFSHILNAQHIWSSRIFNQLPLYDRFYVHPVEFFQNYHNENTNRLKQILEDFGLSANIFYATSIGEKFTNRVGDILLHVVNHSTYHRGQVAMELKLAGLQPPATDFVLMKREGTI
ncbi:damage-inducible protein DinB [Pedobacter sp. HMF7647]|uniref:Damage-inducible protein DinB n=1 Tax=Hufsiella arboris TaxID=2695275 RepID=A0A7K1Y437_9SPHI|nr:DinB family protein [Hufsiella arboris]MXV49346.1 damage-inducible protein DinB [Hufsiella arboris]